VAPSFLTISAEQRHQINGTVSGDHLHSTWWRVIPRCCSHTNNIVDWLRLWRAHLDILIQKDPSKVTIKVDHERRIKRIIRPTGNSHTFL
jgi:hypothetical protein